jgi:hypothetical protein
MAEAADGLGGSAILPGLEFEVAPLLEHLTCPVCMDVMRNATTTVPCAHTFCGKCVRQALNLKHECPMCKAPVQVENLIPNRQCDALIDTLDSQKAAATARYFERLATPPGGSWTGSRTDRDISDDRCGKIEAAFRQHHQQAMIVFQSAAQEVQRAFALRSKYLEEIKQTDASDEVQSRTELERLQVAEEACMDQLAADYETHLQEAMAPLPMLGELAPTVHVDICTQKSVKTISIRLTKTMFLDDLRREVLQRLEESDDPLVALPTKGIYVAVYPPGAHAGGEPARALPATEDVATSLEQGRSAQTTCHRQLSFGEGITLDASRPLLHQTSRLLTGSRIVFRSGADGVQLKLVSEVSTECFRTTFVQGSHVVCDYYCCNTCAMKWICSACALGPCHGGKGHSVVAFALKHKASYGACYCSKRKGQCCLTC